MPLALLLFASVGSSALAEQPQATAGYPKLFRCQSAIERPVPLPSYSAGCLAFREQELDAIRALPLPARRARINQLRTAIGLAPGAGMNIGPDGTLHALDTSAR